MTESCFYFDGQTAQANACTIHVADDSLYIYFENEPDKTIIWSRINIKHFDLNGNQLIIKYGDFPQQTIECNGSNSSQFFDKLSERNLSKKSKSFWLNLFQYQHKQPSQFLTHPRRWQVSWTR